MSAFVVQLGNNDSRTIEEAFSSFRDEEAVKISIQTNFAVALHEWGEKIQEALDSDSLTVILVLNFHGNETGDINVAVVDNDAADNSDVFLSMTAEQFLRGETTLPAKYSNWWEGFSAYLDSISTRTGQVWLIAAQCHGKCFTDELERLMKDERCITEKKLLVRGLSYETTHATTVPRNEKDLSKGTESVHIDLKREMESLFGIIYYKNMPRWQTE
jgi:hypothetical protein